MSICRRRINRAWSAPGVNAITPNWPRSIRAMPVPRKPRRRNSPACLGALAAALQAIECQKLIAGQSAAALIGRQVLIEAATHRQFVTVFRRNPKCRFDHATWKISALRQTPQELSIGAILKPASPIQCSGRAGVRRPAAREEARLSGVRFHAACFPVAEPAAAQRPVLRSLRPRNAFRRFSHEDAALPRGPGSG